MMISKLKKRPLLIVLYMFVFSLAFVGGDCEDILNALIQGDVVGTWQLQRQEGSGQDVCEGEVVEFREDGTALLTCPGGSTISRSYSASNNVLTYTASGVEYQIQTANNTDLVLVGINVTRTLEYTKVSDNIDGTKKAAGDNYNSSEKLK